ncbi:MAG: 40S ribosomal protein S19, partial [Nitrososphaera sp.]
MAKVYDVPADELIAKLAEQLKKDKKIEPPAWSAFVKTGSH